MGQALFRRLMRRRWGRRLLQRLHLRLGYRGHAAVYRSLAKVFREHRWEAEPDLEWRLTFRGRELVLPLRPPHAWLDWDAIASVHGHDVRLKRFYHYALSQGIDGLLDVGANYGLHSLLFLVSGARAISVEPNPRCRSYFSLACARNHVVGDWRPLCLAAASGQRALTFPDRDTWLGSIQEARRAELSADPAAQTIPVDAVALDEMLADDPRPPRLAKIDVEGAEPDVLRGGRGYLDAVRPVVLLESWPGSERRAVFEELARVDARIWPLSALVKQGPPLDLAAFEASTKEGFVVLPKGSWLSDLDDVSLPTRP